MITIGQARDHVLVAVRADAHEPRVDFAIRDALDFRKDKAVVDVDTLAIGEHLQHRYHLQGWSVRVIDATGDRLTSQPDFRLEFDLRPIYDVLKNKETEK